MTSAQPPGARVGKACPAFAFTSVQGQAVRSREILGRRALVILFAAAHLPAGLLAHWDALARRYPDDLALVLVGAAGDGAATLPFYITDDADGALARVFGPEEGTLSAYFVRRDGLVTRIAHNGDSLLTDPAAFDRLLRALIG